MLFRVILAGVMGAAAVAAGPQVEAASDTSVVRYVGMGACRQDDGGRRPCGPWKVWLSDGRVVALPEARRTVAAGEYVAQGVVDVSPDGTQVAYFRERDGVLMIWQAATGRARPIPKVRWPDDLRMDALTLSPQGRFVSMRGVLVSEREVDRIADTVTGKVFTLPKGYQSWSFGPDGKRMLAGNNRTAVLYSTGKWSVKLRRSVYLRGALGPDGVTVAGTRRNDGGSLSNAVQFRNLATGKKSTVPIRLGKGEFPLAARWDKAGHVDVLARSDRQLGGGEYRRTHTWYRLNRTTRKLQRLDSFVIPSSIGGYVLAL
ncbi:TolB family protein [Sphaerisporangium dianthi]|uniref:TolB family protein n=1 Tax=Sphaerisporangium dianthi TaxID=1436120 RepID=A0ABV9CED6_9ACTN